MPSFITVTFKPTLQELANSFKGMNMSGFIKEAVMDFAFLIGRQAKLETPVDKGHLRASIHAEPLGGGLGAKIAPHKVYARWIHEGTMFRKGKQIFIKGYRKTPVGGKPYMFLGVQRATPEFNERLGMKLDRYIQNKLP